MLTNEIRKEKKMNSIIVIKNVEKLKEEIIKQGFSYRELARETGYDNQYECIQQSDAAIKSETRLEQFLDFIQLFFS